MKPPAEFPDRGKAFVTGASGGIGGAIVELLLKQGWDVWGTARSETGLAVFSENAQFHAVILDLDNREGALEAFGQAVADAGEFDVVINNAGYGLFCPLRQVPPEAFDRQLTAMISTTAALIQSQLAMLNRRGRGTLVNVSSLAVEFPLPFMAGYNMAKAALSALSESLMLETIDSGLVVIDFRPGDIKTGFNEVMAQQASAAISASKSANLKSAWATLEKNIASAPSAESAAQTLWHAMRRNRSRVVRCGGLFQAQIAPVLNRLIPERLARFVQWRYFGVK